MRTAMIDYLLSGECPYTSYERLILFVLLCAIRAGRGNISRQKLARAAGIDRKTAGRVFAQLTERGTIVREDGVCVIRDAWFIRPKRGTVGGTIGGDSTISNNININNNTTDARAREGQGGENAPPGAKTAEAGGENASGGAKSPCGEGENAPGAEGENASGTEGENAPGGEAEDAAPRPSVRSDTERLKQLEQQRDAPSVAPVRDTVVSDGHGGRTHLQLSDGEKRFLNVYHKLPADVMQFSAMYRQAIRECGDVRTLIAAARRYLAVLMQEDGSTLYKTAPEKFLACGMWCDYVPQAAAPSEAAGAADAGGDGQRFLAACDKTPRDAEKFRRCFGEAMAEVGDADTLIAAMRDYTDRLLEKDGDLMCLPRPENWLEDHGWRNYVRRYGGSVGGTPGGASAELPPMNLKLYTEEDDGSNES